MKLNVKKLAFSKYFLYLCRENKRYKMAEKSVIEKLLRQLSEDRDEKIRLREQIEGLLAETESLRKSIVDMNEDRKVSEKTLLNTILDLNAKVMKLTDIIAEKDTRIAALEQQLKQQRGKRFAPTAEQARLLNGRGKPEDREDEKDKFDGTSVPGNGNESDAVECSKPAKKVKRGSSTSRKLYSQEPDGAAEVNETVVHRLEDYYTLPEGARFMKRNGKIGIYYYTRIERIPERIIKHVYEVASVIMPDDSIEQTMKTPHIIDKCPLEPSMLAWILVEKYVYHAPINTVKKKLRNAGYNISKSVLGRYFHQGMQALMDLLKDAMHNEVRNAKYLMVDETAELVGIEDEKTGERCYRKKYLWAFFDKVKGMVAYVYEHGSRARKVVLDFLQNFSGYISTDGYVAYSIFDDAEKHPDITRIGCWTHARRMFVEALESERKECTHMINNIGELFAVEIKAKIAGMDEVARRALRQRESVHILVRILIHLRRLSKDAEIMANPLMKKAVNYMLNQWSSLRTYIISGLVEISNNLCEQRMKPIKLTLKNCQNIGSEDAAERCAFLQSLTESCSLNKINPLEYITSLLDIIYKKEEITNKTQLLPCYWKSNC